MPRYEKKFLLRDNQDLIIECMLDKSLSLDPNCSNLKCYTVHSLYFDDYLDSAFHDVEAGILKKIKFRIRRYNDNVEDYKLEIKRKNNDEVAKEFCYLKKDEVLKIMNNDISDLFWNTNNAVLKKFLIAMQTKFLRPKIIVTYNRVPFVNFFNDLRITIDKNISYSRDVNNFTNNFYFKNKLYEKILEVKYNDFIPKDIRKILSDFYLFRVAFSKYYNSRYECQKLGEVV